MDISKFADECADQVAKLMAVSAITAPKTKGENFVEVCILQGSELIQLAESMDAYGKRTSKKNFDRDAGNVRRSNAVVLIGLKDASFSGLDCGACGFDTCAEMTSAQKSRSEFVGPICALRILDMGIALGSAVKTASLMNVDNRIMYRIGAVAREMGLVDWDFIMGIPLSITGKSIYFDR
jgi:uncharacterized ferredoxin-like protein